MAKLATLREASRHVIRIRRPLEIRQVAGYARPARQVVAAKFRIVAIRALPRRYRMQPRQGEPSHAVVELPIRPGNGVVARLAVRREPLVRYRAGGVVVVVLMARNASR